MTRKYEETKAQDAKLQSLFNLLKSASVSDSQSLLARLRSDEDIDSLLRTVSSIPNLSPRQVLDARLVVAPSRQASPVPLVGSCALAPKDVSGPVLQTEPMESQKAPNDHNCMKIDSLLAPLITTWAVASDR